MYRPWVVAWTRAPELFLNHLCFCAGLKSVAHRGCQLAVFWQPYLYALCLVCTVNFHSATKLKIQNFTNRIQMVFCRYNVHYFQILCVLTFSPAILFISSNLSITETYFGLSSLYSIRKFINISIAIFPKRGTLLTPP